MRGGHGGLQGSAVVTGDDWTGPGLVLDWMTGRWNLASPKAGSTLRYGPSTYASAVGRGLSPRPRSRSAFLSQTPRERDREPEPTFSSTTRT